MYIFWQLKGIRVFALRNCGKLRGMALYTVRASLMHLTNSGIANKVSDDTDGVVKRSFRLVHDHSVGTCNAI